MKGIFTAAAAVLLALSISNSVLAHSHLGGSNPADGDIVSEPLNEIRLQFEGQIEQGSFIDITTKSGQSVEVQEVIIGKGTLTGTVAEPLPNDEYEVNWSIISADGHPVEGKFSFSVNVPIANSVEKETEESSEKTAIENSPETTETEKKVSTADEVEEEASSTTIILIVLLVVIVAGGFIFLTKRKK